MSRLPQPLPEDAGSPQPRLSNQQFELVIRRAAELQARAAEETGDEGLPEAEALRIGKELGLSGRYLRQALAEVRGQSTAKPGMLDRLVGPAVLQASRTVAGEVEEVQRILELYLLQHEYLTVLRRFPDRTVYQRASGVAAALGRAASQVFRRAPLLQVATLEVAVQPLEEGFCYVTLSTSLAGPRASHLAGGVLGGGALGGGVALVLGIAVDPLAAVLGAPVLGGGVLGSQWAYTRTVDRVQTQLEALLERLEHGELPRETLGRRARRS